MYPNLDKLIIWVLIDGGAGIAAYAVIGVVPALEKLRADYKRYTAIALAGVFALAAYLVAVKCGLRPSPLGFWAWVDALIGNIGPVLVWSQAVHGARVLASNARRIAPRTVR